MTTSVVLRFQPTQFFFQQHRPFVLLRQFALQLLVLREAITKSDASEARKMDLVADTETIQTQLAKPKPSSKIIAAAWEGVKGAAALNGLAGIVGRVRILIAPLLG